MRRSILLLSLLAACHRDPPGSDADAPPSDSDTPSADTDPTADTDTPTDDTDTDLPADTDTDVVPPPPPPTPDAVTDCGVPLPPVTDGLCDATRGTNGATVLRGDLLLESGVLLDGAVVIGADGVIAYVGCDPSTSALAAQADVVTCPDGVISPGLINSHDHLTFSENAPSNDNGQRYEHRHDWRGSLSTPSNPHGTGGTSAGNRWVELRQLLAGTTTIVGSGGAVGLLRNPDEGDNEGIDLPPVENETFPLNDSNESQRSDCSWSYKLTEGEVAELDAYVPHIAEGINDRAHIEFACQSRSVDGAQDYAEANAAHVHGVGLYAQDYWNMARDHAMLVWSPRSNISLYGVTADVSTFDTLGGRIALGTDWTYSGSASMTRELACAASWNDTYLNRHFTDGELWLMATANGADALGAGDQIGRLAEGWVGDVAIYDGRVHPLHRAVIDAGATDVALVLRGGERLFGEADTLSELGDACDAIPMCGADRSVCLTRDLGISYSALEASVSGAYPAFFCGAPTREPTCTPSRPGAFTGEITPVDSDGDGVRNNDDNCNRTFNPVRPMDDGAQADADADGRGDACDDSPLPVDLDGDGVDNLADNCPFDANPDQIDFEGDGKGDTCDTCPDVSNPLGVCPPAPAQLVTIPEVRTTLGNGVVVAIEGVVTAVASNGFAVQDPTIASGQNAGVWVFTGSAPSVSRGDRVRVEGETDEYFTEKQISEDATTVLGAGAPVAPVALSAADAALEVYEGALVTVDGAVTDDAYDCSVDGAACADANLWEIGGGAGVLAYDKCYEDGDWATHTAETPVTGVMSFRWNRRRVMPRDANDFGP
jgi:cytosine/adenosine deaminase-related metal-dependent hydrolase